MIRRFFFKRVFSYFITMIIPTLLIFAVIGYSFLTSQREALRQQDAATLNSLEKSIETTFYNSGFQIDAMLNNSSFALSLRKVLRQIPMDQKERYFYEMLKNLFLTYEVAYPYVHSIYVYMDNYERFMSSSSGQIANVNTYYDTEWLDIYEDMSPEAGIYTCKRWVQRNSYDEPIELISVFYRNTRVNGVTVINIDKNEFGKLLRTIAFAEQQMVFLLNSSGNIVCASDSNYEVPGIENQLRENGFLETTYLQTQNSQNGQIKIDGERYSIYAQKLQSLDLYLVSAISERYMYSQLGHYFLLGAIVLLVDILFILFLAHHSTKRSFRFIEEYITIFSEVEKEYAEQERDAIRLLNGDYGGQTNRAEDEYAMILDSIRFLHVKSRQMQADLLERQYQHQITEMQALQLQINPHFIFNTLQIVDIEMIKNNGTSSVSHKMLQGLSKVVKYALTNPMEEVTLAEELDYLKSYLEIQKVRFENRVIIYFDVADAALDIKIFRLLLQPMFENSFTHGMRIDGKQLLIKLKVFVRGGKAYFTLIDNGRGMSKKRIAELYDEFEQTKSRSIGLANVNRRLVLRYGPAGKLAIKSKVNWGTVIQFVIPADECRD